MRTLPDGLSEHLAKNVTTMCRAWRVKRRDGVILGFTDHDADLVFDGTVFGAASGFSASAVEGELGLSVATSEVVGAFSAETLTAPALREGRFDGARVEVFAVNWAQPGDHVLLHVHELGDVSHAGEAFRAELRGLAHRLERTGGRVYARRCDADLGDARCGIDLETGERLGIGAVTLATARDRIRVEGLDGFAEGWFRHGMLLWIAGANAGLRVEVLDHVLRDGAVHLHLWVPPVNLPEPGDTFSVTAGCDKTFATCREKFANGLNFQGFPHLPGSDFAYGYADGDTVHDGRPLVS